MKKLLFTLIGIALLGFGSAKADNSVVAVINVQAVGNIYGHAAVQPQLLASASDNSELLLLLFSCYTATSSLTDNDGHTFVGTATYCNDIDAIARMGAEQRADFNLTCQLIAAM